MQMVGGTGKRSIVRPPTRSEDLEKIALIHWMQDVETDNMVNITMIMVDITMTIKVVEN